MTLLVKSVINYYFFCLADEVSPPWEFDTGHQPTRPMVAPEPWQRTTVWGMESMAPPSMPQLSGMFHHSEPQDTAAFISIDHLNKLERTNAAPMWRQIARRLRYEHLPHRPHAFSDVDLEAIAKRKNEVDSECLRAVLVSWRDRSIFHTGNPFCNVLVEVGLGRVAEEVFGFHGASTSSPESDV